MTTRNGSQYLVSVCMINDAGLLEWRPKGFRSYRSAELHIKNSLLDGAIDIRIHVL